MSKSAILSSSIAKKYWMSLTGLFLCLFLVGHLIGNLQLIFITGEEGKRAFNEYAYFMSHNPLVKILSYVTYLSILFHAIDGFLLAYQNQKARPVKYAYNKPGANSSGASRNMAILGSAILIFIVIHMANFWWPMKYSSKPMPLHRTVVVNTDEEQNPMTGEIELQSVQIKHYYTTKGEYLPYTAKDLIKNQEIDLVEQEYVEKETHAYNVKNGTELYHVKTGLKDAEAYKDLHSLVLAFFGHDKSKEGFPKNDYAMVAVVLYVLSMAVLAFHLFHGFQSAFQSLGLNHKKYTPAIKNFGVFFSIVVPLLFAIIPVVIFMKK